MPETLKNPFKPGDVVMCVNKDRIEHARNDRRPLRELVLGDLYVVVHSHTDSYDWTWNSVRVQDENGHVVGGTSWVPQRFKKIGKL